MGGDNLAIDSIASLLANLRSDHAVAMCGRKSIDIYSSKGPPFMFGMSHCLSMISLPILNPSLFALCCSEHPKVIFIQKAFRSLKQIFIEENVKNAFQVVQFEVDIMKISYPLRLREEKLRQNGRFQPIPHLDWRLGEV
jgi:hypothetical protein